MARLGRKEWEIGALEMIGELGFAALAVEPLARRLGISKGSFYWHFADQDDLVRAALARWERVFTDLKYGALEKVPDPARRLEPLFGDVATHDPATRVFLALLEARDDPRVRRVLGRAIGKRLALLTATFQELGLDETAARDRAVLLTSAYAGFLQLGDLRLPGIRTRRERQAFVERLFRAVTSGA